jgi:hypothetical protein
MRRPSSSLRSEPQRSRSAIVLSLAVSATLIGCAIFLLDIAGPTRKAAAAVLYDGQDFGVNYLPDLEAAVAFRFVYPGFACLFLAAAFAALALAAHSGPRWTVVALGVLCGLGTAFLLYLAVLRFFGDFSVGDHIYDAIMDLLKWAAPEDFNGVEEIPALATLFGLPTIGLLLIIGHYAKDETAHRRV